MEKKIICYDIDGTLTSEMLFMPLIKSEYDNGILDEASYVSIIEVLKAYKNGEIAYEDAVEALIQRHARGLADKDVSTVASNAVQFVNSHADLFRPFGKMIINALKDDCLQFAVTAEPQYIADAVSSYLGLDRAYASEYEILEGKFTGMVTSSLAGRKQKAELLRSYKIFASFGDSEGDIEMLAHSQHAVCVEPSKELRAQAEARDWNIFSGDDDPQSILKLLRK